MNLNTLSIIASVNIIYLHKNILKKTLPDDRNILGNLARWKPFLIIFHEFEERIKLHNINSIQ